MKIYERTDKNYKIVSVYMDHYPYKEKKYIQDKLHKLIKGFHDNAVKHGLFHKNNYFLQKFPAEKTVYFSVVSIFFDIFF